MKRLTLPLIILAFFTLFSVTGFALGFSKTRTYTDNFKDVSSSEWYSSGIANVYELALMEGVSADTFDIDSEMTVAQAITIAARLHSIYNGTETPKSGTGVNWYKDFVSYCKDNGIITDKQFDSYNRSVLSYEMVELFSSALPESFFPAVNDISYIQDVPQNAYFYKDVMLFYRAGILNGNDSYGTFYPMSAITRKRAAVILARTVLAPERLTYSLSAKKESYSINDILSILDSQTVKDTLDGINLISADGYNVSAAEYRYYLYISQNNNDELEKQIKSSAAIVNTIKEMNLVFSYDVLCDILLAYYDLRIDNYGSQSYFTALEAQKLSDSVFAKLIAVNELYKKAMENEAFIPAVMANQSSVSMTYAQNFDGIANLLK